MKQPYLFLFVEDFSSKNNEAFFEREIPYLLEKFEQVMVIPLFNKNTQLTINDSRVKVIHFDLFSATNRLKTLFQNPGLVKRVFLCELKHTHNKTFYLKNFASLLNTLLIRIASAKKLEVFIKNNLNDSLFYTYWFNQWTFALSLIKEKFPQMKLVTRIHGKDYDESQVKTILTFRYYQLQKVNRIFPASDYGRKYLLEQFNFSQATTSHLGLNNKAQPGPVDSQSLHLVSCASVIPLKRVHLMVEILKHINMPVKWTHIGDGVLFEDLKAKTKTLPAHIKCDLKGYVYNAEIFDFYKKNPVSVFVHLTETEGGVPVCISEATSFGIPVIGTDVCGVPEIVNNQTGFLIPLNFDPKVVADLITTQHKAGTIYSESFRAGVQEFYSKNFYAPENYKTFSANLSALMTKSN